MLPVWPRFLPAALYVEQKVRTSGNRADYQQLYKLRCWSPRKLELSPRILTRKAAAGRRSGQGPRAATKEADKVPRPAVGLGLRQRDRQARRLPARGSRPNAAAAAAEDIDAPEAAEAPRAPAGEESHIRRRIGCALRQTKKSNFCGRNDVYRNVHRT